MKRLHDLRNLLFRQGFYSESREIDSLIKTASISGLKTLLLKDSAAQLFSSIIGDKWNYVIAKWFIECHLLGQSFAEFTGGFYPQKNDPILNLKALNACDKLLAKPIEAREAFCQKDIDCKNLKNWTRAMDLDLEFAWKNNELDEWSMQYLRRDSPIHPDETIRNWMEELKSNLTQKISYFIETDFIKDLMSNKFISSGQAKSQSYYETEKAWMEKKTLSLPTVVKFEDNWKWVDAGGGKSKWVAQNLKNCGSVTWGNLRATTESKDKARMIVLMDPENKPHALVTWNPEYVDYEAPNKAPIKYLGHIEGVGSNPLKPEYYSYFEKLVSHYQPDKIYISNTSNINSNGETIDNKNLKKLFDPQVLLAY